MAHYMRVSGQSLIVTGAARGIGAAIAGCAAREGARVTAVDRDAVGLESLAKSADVERLALQTVVADVATADGNAQAVAAAENRFGPVNTFIANAAIIRFLEPLVTTEEDWDAIHRVNLKGAHLGVQASIPSLRRAGGGSIVLIASVLAVVGDPLLSAYGAAKGGLRALCRSIAVAYGAENIRCNTICPGRRPNRHDARAIRASRRFGSGSRGDARPLPAAALRDTPRHRPRRDVSRFRSG